jgi:hypothetical protein
MADFSSRKAGVIQINFCTDDTKYVKDLENNSETICRHHYFIYHGKKQGKIKNMAEKDEKYLFKKEIQK